MHLIDRQRIRDAIDAVERSTTARVAVRILPHLGKDPVEKAKAQLQEARLHHHKQRNSVVFVVAPRTRQFAVYGDEAVHDKLGEDYWARLVDAMAERFKTGNPTAALVYGIERVGEQLQSHFPKAESVP